MIKHRLFVPILILACSWAGCGVQAYLMHRNNVAQQELKDAMQQVRDATHRLDDAKRHVEEETERLERLLKMLPSPPAPNRTSKL